MKKIVAVVMSLCLVFSASSVAFANEGNEVTQAENYCEYKIYSSIEEAMLDTDEPEYALDIVPDATMTPKFIRSGNTTRVQMMLTYAGKDPAYLLEIEELEVWEDNLDPLTKELGEANIGLEHTKVRVDWKSAKVCTTTYGWVRATDPIGAFEIR